MIEDPIQRIGTAPTLYRGKRAVLHLDRGALIFHSLRPPLAASPVGTLRHQQLYLAPGFEAVALPAKRSLNSVSLALTRSIGSMTVSTELLVLSSLIRSFANCSRRDGLSNCSSAMASSITSISLCNLMSFLRRLAAFAPLRERRRDSANTRRFCTITALNACSGWT